MNPRLSLLATLFPGAGCCFAQDAAPEAKDAAAEPAKKLSNPGAVKLRTTTAK